MKTLKRVMVVVLALALVLTAVPQSAKAANEEVIWTTASETYNAQWGNLMHIPYETLKACFDKDADATILVEFTSTQKANYGVGNVGARDTYDGGIGVSTNVDAPANSIVEFKLADFMKKATSGAGINGGVTVNFYNGSNPVSATVVYSAVDALPTTGDTSAVFYVAILAVVAVCGIVIARKRTSEEF